MNDNERQIIQALAARVTPKRALMEASGYGFMSVQVHWHPSAAWLVSMMVQTPEEKVETLTFAVPNEVLADVAQREEFIDPARVFIEQGLYKHQEAMKVDE